MAWCALSLRTVELVGLDSYQAAPSAISFAGNPEVGT
jgi:hypothetical protein